MLSFLCELARLFREGASQQEIDTRVTAYGDIISSYTISIPTVLPFLHDLISCSDQGKQYLDDAGVEYTRLFPSLIQLARHLVKTLPHHDIAPFSPLIDQWAGSPGCQAHPTLKSHLTMMSYSIRMRNTAPDQKTSSRSRGTLLAQRQRPLPGLHSIGIDNPTHTALTKSLDNAAHTTRARKTDRIMQLSSAVFLPHLHFMHLQQAWTLDQYTRFLSNLSPPQSFLNPIPPGVMDKHGNYSTRLRLPCILPAATFADVFIRLPNLMTQRASLDASCGVTSHATHDDLVTLLNPGRGDNPFAIAHCCFNQFLSDVSQYVEHAEHQQQHTLSPLPGHANHHRTTPQPCGGCQHEWQEAWKTNAYLSPHHHLLALYNRYDRASSALCEEMSQTIHTPLLSSASGVQLGGNGASSKSKSTVNADNTMSMNSNPPAADSDKAIKQQALHIIDSVRSRMYGMSEEGQPQPSSISSGTGSNRNRDGRGGDHISDDMGSYFLSLSQDQQEAFCQRYNVLPHTCGSPIYHLLNIPPIESNDIGNDNTAEIHDTRHHQEKNEQDGGFGITPSPCTYPAALVGDGAVDPVYTSDTETYPPWNLTPQQRNSYMLKRQQPAVMHTQPGLDMKHRPHTDIHPATPHLQQHQHQQPQLQHPQHSVSGHGRDGKPKREITTRRARESMPPALLLSSGIDMMIPTMSSAHIIQPPTPAFVAPPYFRSLDLQHRLNPAITPRGSKNLPVVAETLRQGTMLHSFISEQFITALATHSLRSRLIQSLNQFHKSYPPASLWSSKRQPPGPRSHLRQGNANVSPDALSLNLALSRTASAGGPEVASAPPLPLTSTASSSVVDTAAGTGTGGTGPTITATAYNMRKTSFIRRITPSIGIQRIFCGLFVRYSILYAQHIHRQPTAQLKAYILPTPSHAISATTTTSGSTTTPSPFTTMHRLSIAHRYLEIPPLQLFKRLSWKTMTPAERFLYQRKLCQAQHYHQIKEVPLIFFDLDALVGQIIYASPLFSYSDMKLAHAMQTITKIMDSSHYQSLPTSVRSRFHHDHYLAAQRNATQQRATVAGMLLQFLHIIALLFTRIVLLPQSSASGITEAQPTSHPQSTQMATPGTTTQGAAAQGTTTDQLNDIDGNRHPPTIPLDPVQIAFYDYPQTPCFYPQADHTQEHQQTAPYEEQQVFNRPPSLLFSKGHTIVPVPNNLQLSTARQIRMWSRMLNNPSIRYVAPTSSSGNAAGEGVVHVHPRRDGGPAQQAIADLCQAFDLIDEHSQPLIAMPTSCANILTSMQMDDRPRDHHRDTMSTTPPHPGEDAPSVGIFDAIYQIINNVSIVSAAKPHAQQPYIDLLLDLITIFRNLVGIPLTGNAPQTANGGINTSIMTWNTILCEYFTRHSLLVKFTSQDALAVMMAKTLILGLSLPLSYATRVSPLPIAVLGQATNSPSSPAQGLKHSHGVMVPISDYFLSACSDQFPLVHMHKHTLNVYLQHVYAWGSRMRRCVGPVLQPQQHPTPPATGSSLPRRTFLPPPHHDAVPWERIYSMLVPHGGDILEHLAGSQSNSSRSSGASVAIDLQKLALLITTTPPSALPQRHRRPGPKPKSCLLGSDSVVLLESIYILAKFDASTPSATYHAHVLHNIATTGVVRYFSGVHAERVYIGKRARPILVSDNMAILACINPKMDDGRPPTPIAHLIHSSLQYHWASSQPQGKQGQRIITEHFAPLGIDVKDYFAIDIPYSNPHVAPLHDTVAFNHPQQHPSDVQPRRRENTILYSVMLNTLTNTLGVFCDPTPSVY